MNGGLESESASFGPFRLFPTARAVEKNGLPIILGNRALDILIVLVERAGEIVSQKELMSRVWRGLVVDPANLRVHMTGLRKALGDAGEARYIANVPGQGYCFVAPVQRGTTTNSHARTPEHVSSGTRKTGALPPPLARMVGRDEAVRTIVSDLIADRFVSIIGPGGMGKTTVAVRVAHAMREEFADAVCFVDLSAVTEAKLVAATIASTLGLSVQREDVVPALLQFLRTLRMLLVLDNCEHVIDATATLAERIFHEAPGIHILATSREALRAEGEHAFWLPPLAAPSPENCISAAHALTFPAVKLFMDRVVASGSRFELLDADAALVAGICVQLDGIALAIEIAAGRVGTYGIAATAELLNERLPLRWPGRRTAPSRHQTLQSLLDWSYSALEEFELRVLRRLSIFVGTFTIAAAQAIACEEAAQAVRVIDAVDSLVAKSLISAVVTGDSEIRYRLLETTRAYASEKLDESGETQLVAHRHAAYFASVLAGANNGGELTPSTREHLLGNVREALEWCHDVVETPSAIRSPALAIALTAGAVPIFLELSLLNECQKWSVAALKLLDDTTRGSFQEMVLLEAQAISSTWALGNSEGVRVALSRALEIARCLGETSRRLRLQVGMHVFLLRIGDMSGSLAVAEDFYGVARTEMDSSSQAVSEWLLGSSHHFMGNQAVARRHFRKGFARPSPLNVQIFGLDYRVRALVTYDRVLWLSGFPDRALKVAQEAIDEAAKLGTPLNVCFSFVYTAPAFLWCGDHSAARDVLDRLMTHPSWHALPSLHATAFALQGELLIGTGEVERGITLLRSALTTMRTDQQTLMLARATCALAQGLMITGQSAEALTLLDKAIAEAGDAGETAEFPELLRIQAELLLTTQEADVGRAEDCLVRALTAARRQAALAWELRIVMTFARLRRQQGRDAEAHEMLSHVYGQFSEGFETADLKSARLLLNELETASGVTGWRVA